MTEGGEGLEGTLKQASFLIGFREEQVTRTSLVHSIPRETEKSGGKPLGAKQRSNKLNPLMTPDLEIEPGPHWWEAVFSPLRHLCIPKQVLCW